MKLRAVSLCFIFILCHLTAFGAFETNCNQTNSKEKYHCLRYVNLNYLGSPYYMDLSDVSGIFKDTHGHIVTTRNAIWGTGFPVNGLWVLFKNGQWLYLGPDPQQAPLIERWVNYQTFIFNNPEFLQIQ